MNIHRSFRCIAVSLALTCTAFAAEVLPPAPARHFNDYAAVVPAATAAQLDSKLEDFERTTSCQVVVAVFPKMQSSSSIEDYTHRIAESWKIGQKQKKNGVGLFVFIQDRTMRIEVGYGLEGALPDALAKRIIEDEIKPGFKRGDFAAGLSAGVDAILKATRGEYKGSGTTAARQTTGELSPILLFFLCVLILFIIVASRRSRGVVYYSGGRSNWGSSGGSFSSGGFSGGGGSFGGGGASGSW